MTELEQGWLVRSLYRDDKLSQPEIARRLDRHKSWVCRRLILVEALDLAVQGDVRLGLIAPRAAIAARGSWKMSLRRTISGDLSASDGCKSYALERGQQERGEDRALPLR